MILQGFRCLFCSAGLCEYTGQSGGLCPGRFGEAVAWPGAVQVGQLGGMKHLQHQAAIPAAKLGINHCISGVVWVSGTGTAAWGGQERDFPMEISVLFCKCKSWE